jgi:type VI protein secretion system component Hcp
VDFAGRRAYDHARVKDKEGPVGTFRFRWITPLVAVALVAGAATGIAQLSDNFNHGGAPLPKHGLMETYLSMTGANTGKFEGPATFFRESRTIPLVALDTEYDSNDFSPACQDISFRKATDQTTPLLFASLNSGEEITSATFDEWRVGKQPMRTFQISLTGGHITAVHHVWASTTGAYDEVTLRPTGNLTFTYWAENDAGKSTKTSKQLTCYS